MSFLYTSTILAAISFQLGVVYAASPPASCTTFVIPGVAGGYTQRVFTDFSSVTPSQNAASFLQSNGYGVNAYHNDGGSFVSHDFLSSNVYFGTGALNLRVNAYSGSGTIGSAEVQTQQTFKYGSVRTVLKASNTPGIVIGNFFYANDNQEIDWEILTSTIDTSSACVPKGIWATNQPLVPGTPSTHSTITFPFDPRADFHEYRIDWTPDATRFYLDGQQVAKLTTNVPTVAGPWIWNVWSNGDPCWSNGPPIADAVTQIRSIEIYKGYAATVSGSNVCNV